MGTLRCARWACGPTILSSGTPRIQTKTQCCYTRRIISRGACESACGKVPYRRPNYLQLIVMPKTNFAAWNQTNLANFAADAERKLSEQMDRIEQLKEERDVAIKAYRSLLAKPLQAADADFGTQRRP